MDILIEELDGSLWTTALKDGRLEGLEVDPAGEEVRWGAVYWARVIRVDKAQDAVYLNLDGDNKGILYNKDVRYQDKDGKTCKGGAQPIGKRFKPGAMVKVQAKTSYLANDLSDKEFALEDKLARMSMDITLPGRYMIYCVNEGKNRVSIRIRDKKLRKKLLDMLNALEDIQGCILRAAAANVQTDVLVREGKILKHSWDIMQGYMEGEEPCLIAAGPDAIQRTLSDQALNTITRIEVVTMDHFGFAEEWTNIFAPDLVTKIEPVELDNASEDLALFHYRDIIGQIEELLQPYAILGGGGSIIIQPTSALTAIDVNRGADSNSKLAINIQAAKEIARQIRLRNIGGIIIVDFLKLKSKAEEGKLIAALENAFNNDPCTVQIHGMSALGLLELTRNRRTLALEKRFSGLEDE